MVQNFSEIIITVRRKNDEKEFGRIVQMLLTLIFSRLGFEIIECKLSGRPDIKVLKNSERYALEVKAPCANVTLSSEDIKGTIVEGFEPLIAIFYTASVEPKWFILDARKIQPGKYIVPSLEQYHVKHLEDEINEELPSTTRIYKEDIITGENALLKVVKEKISLFL